MPLPASTYFPGPVSPQQLNIDLYGSPVTGPSGVLFHANRPLISETVLNEGTAYFAQGAQPVAGPGIEAFSVIDTTALFGAGSLPGINALFEFTNTVPSSSGAAGTVGGWWLTWGFPRLGDVTVPPGGVGAGMAVNTTFRDVGTFQYGATGQNNTPYYFDLVNSGTDIFTWQPAFYWRTNSVPVIEANPNDTSGVTTRMGFLWQACTYQQGSVTAVPVVSSSWGTVTSVMLNTMGSALTLLNNPPSLHLSTRTGQSIPQSTLTVFQFTGTPDLDNYNGWSTAASAYTAPLNGLYLFSPNVAWGTTSSTGIRWSGLQVTAGGTTIVHQGPSYGATLVAPGAVGTGFTGTAQVRILALNAGDKVSAIGAQNSGANSVLYTGLNTRFTGAYMSQQAATGTTLTWTPPVTGFRFQAGALSGTALTATLNARIGNDLNFLLNRPYFTGYQATAQGGFASGSGFHQVTIDTVGALPRGGNGDNYGGWSAANHWYVSQVAGWYLVMADLYPVSPLSGTTGVLTAGIFCSTSGSITPSSSPDNYQQVLYPVTTVGNPPGGFAAGLYYLLPGEYVYPMLNVVNWGTWATFVGTGSTSTIHSQFSCFWVSELWRAHLSNGGPA